LVIPGANIPLYVQLKQSIQDQITSGELAANAMLPGERELGNLLGLSRTTVRLALNELVSEGVLYRHHGKGTFVARRKYKPNMAWLTGFAEELKWRGLAPTVQVLTARMQEAGASIAARLSVPQSEPIAYIQRLVAIDSTPIFTDSAYIISPIGSMVIGADLQNDSIYNIIERLGYPIHGGEQNISAIALSEYQAELLAARAGDPALVISRITFIEPGKPIEYSEAIYRGDRYEYSILLQRNPASTLPNSTEQLAAGSITTT
jgi:GntR family transcriptional regulator